MEMLFCVFERKALCCPKDVSAPDDLVHDFVYCLQFSLVLKALRLFPRLLRFPRREKPHGYWTLLCLQQAQEAKRSRGERLGAITHVFSCFRLCYHSAGFLGKGGVEGQELAESPMSYSCPAISSISWDRFGSGSRLSIRPTFLTSHNKLSVRCKHIKCLNW